MSIKSTIAAAAALIASVNGHMIMQSPVPYSVDKVDSGPITASQFPCKSNLGFTVSKMNSMAVGEKQTLSFKGSAVHGGGSCQLSVTTDTEPTANSVFKVIKTMEGGCPGVDGPSTFDFELPASIPNGKATFAWTWFAKLSGGPEMYMNCAPIDVTGGASDKSGFDALPNMLVANIATSSCKSPTSKVLKIPNPGKNLVVSGPESDIVDGTGDCGTSSGGSTPGGSTPAQPSSPAGQPSSAPKSSPAAQPTQPAGGAPPVAAPSSAPSAPPSNPGGVFAPGASGAPAQSTKTTLVTVTGAPTPAQPTVPASPGTGTPSVPSSPAAPPASPPTSGGGSAGTCSTNGAVVCNGEKQFGLCNNGNVVWQEVAAGTACVNGVISKRELNGRVARPRYGGSRVVRAAN